MASERVLARDGAVTFNTSAAAKVFFVGKHIRTAINAS
jgi:hypothetical protein